MGIVFYKNLAIPTIFTIFSLLFITVFILSIKTKITTQNPINQNTKLYPLLFISIIIIGYCNSYFQTRAFFEQKAELKNSSINYLKGAITEKRGDTKRIRYTFTLDQVQKDTSWNPAVGKILFSCDHCDSLKIGSEWVVKSNLHPISSIEENYLPDYANYYHNQGIFYQQYLHQKDLMKFTDQNRSINTIASKVNTQFKNILKSYLDDENFAVANALVLGNKNFLSEDIKEIYAKSGIMHILAVSGLHVGIVYLILHFALSSLRKSKSGRIWFFFISTLLLWAYAFITGLSTSVIRASTMFTLFLGSDLLDRRNYSLNAAALSAIIMLIFDPLSLFDIGFQLSYAAVFSILLFYHTFYNIYQPENAIVRFLWQITCVSLSVQILTFPITIYYFHHFQPMFLVFNILAIPFAFCTLMLGFMIIFTSPIPAIAKLIGMLLNLIISSFNGTVAKLHEYFPGSGYLSLESFEVFIIFALVLAFFGFLYRRKIGYLALMTLLITGLSGHYLWKMDQVNNQSGIEILGDSSPTLITYAGKDYHYLTMQDSLTESFRLTSFINYHSLENLQDTIPEINNENMELLVSNNTSILILKNHDLTLPDDFYVDILVLPKYTPSPIKNYYSKFANRIITQY